MVNIREQVARKAQHLQEQLEKNPNLSPYIDQHYPIPDIFLGTGDIRLVIIGQDPTVKNPSSRGQIKVVLNLDKKGSVRAYISQICEEFKLELDKNVYATNLFKNFFVRPPTQIKECDILDIFSQYWLPLLREELKMFPNVPIITLGEPLLRVLLIDRSKARVRKYWDYKQGWQVNKANRPTAFSFVVPKDNKLGRMLFPFPHQPSLIKKFYTCTLREYLNYMKTKTYP